MHRHRLVVALLLAGAIAIAAACSGEVVAPVPETVEGTVAQPTASDATTEGGGATTEGGGATTEGGGATTEGGGATTEGDPAAGKLVFADSCGVCHTLSDAGTAGTVGPNLDGLALDFDTVHEQVVNGGGAMPPFSGVISDQQINDVAAYVVQATAG